MTHIDSIFRKITKTNIYTHLVGLFSPWYTVGKTLRQINILGLECVCFFYKFARFCLTKLVNNSRIKWINGPTQLLPVKKKYLDENATSILSKNKYSSSIHSNIYSLIQMN